MMSENVRSLISQSVLHGIMLRRIRYFFDMDSQALGEGSIPFTRFFGMSIETSVLQRYCLVLLGDTFETLFRGLRHFFCHGQKSPH